MRYTKREAKGDAGATDGRRYVGLNLEDVLHDFEAKRRPAKEVRPESAEAT